LKRGLGVDGGQARDQLKVGGLVELQQNVPEGNPNGSGQKKVKSMQRKSGRKMGVRSAKRLEKKSRGSKRIVPCTLGEGGP